MVTRIGDKAWNDLIQKTETDLESLKWDAVEAKKVARQAEYEHIAAQETLERLLERITAAESLLEALKTGAIGK